MSRYRVARPLDVGLGKHHKVELFAGIARLCLVVYPIQGLLQPLESLNREGALQNLSAHNRADQDLPGKPLPARQVDRHRRGSGVIGSLRVRWSEAKHALARRRG